MHTSLITIGVVMLLAVMSPGPDFAVVTKNALLNSRRAGYFTALGIATGTTIHVSYCIFGVALLIMHSTFLFDAIKFLGGGYLIYIGVQSLRHLSDEVRVTVTGKSQTISNRQAFQQGLLTNLLNPKATLFFLSLFAITVNANTSRLTQFELAVEMIGIAFIWFCTLSTLITHRSVNQWLLRSQRTISLLMGIALIAIGLVVVIWVKR